MLREIWVLVKTIALAALIALFTVQFVVQPTIVEGNSMEPVVSSGERLLVNKLIYRFALPQRGDIIVLKTGNNNPEYLKRIVGLPGEEVEIRKGLTYINGEILNEPYLKERMVGEYGPYTVPENNVFVMGDNRNNSLDSRSPSLGFISLEQISGRADFVFWPFFELKVLAGDPGR